MVISASAATRAHVRTPSMILERLSPDRSEGVPPPMNTVRTSCSASASRHDRSSPSSAST